MNQSVQKVFDIAELVEAIFSFLPPSTILIVTRVNHDFKNAVVKSMKLKQLLHLCPLPSTPASIPPTTLFDGSDPAFKNIEVVFSRVDQGHPDSSLLDGELDELPVEIYRVLVILKPTVDAKGNQHFPSPIGPLCRRMLICQPPTSWLRFTPWCEGRIKLLVENESSMQVRLLPVHLRQGLMSRRGVTVGEVYDACLETWLNLRSTSGRKWEAVWPESVPEFRLAGNVFVFA